MMPTLCQFAIFPRTHLMACQICLEDFCEILASDPQSRRTQKLCGADSDCSADLCARCLSQHIATTLDNCILGLLPRVRCPICLVQINKTKWIHCVHPDASSLLAYRYEKLAQTALSLKPECCDDDEYTHLPEYRGGSATSPSSMVWDGATPELQALLTAFEDHRVDASRVVACLVDTPQDGDASPDRDSAMDNILRRVYDDERRAALLLSFLYRFPYTRTVCCAESVCFNCKGIHYESDPCDEENGFDELTCMTRCRRCRVMLVVTEGCDTVMCVCGFYLNWGEELGFRDRHKNALLPVDLFDVDSMDTYKRKKLILDYHLKTQCETIRRKRIDALINDHRGTLSRLLARRTKTVRLVPEQHKSEYADPQEHHS